MDIVKINKYKISKYEKLFTKLSILYLYVKKHQMVIVNKIAITSYDFKNNF